MNTFVASGHCVEFCVIIFKLFMQLENPIDIFKIPDLNEIELTNFLFNLNVNDMSGVFGSHFLLFLLVLPRCCCVAQASLVGH